MSKLYIEWRCPNCDHTITGEKNEVLEQAFDHLLDCDQ